ncbi:iron ABC transporter permease [Microbacterium jejuense]|uniref:FecCD family ABC transporter permease n=1 Tax=Microbacterium jejuense TaxID=1263637 RepID=UPI0031EBE051
MSADTTPAATRRHSSRSGTRPARRRALGAAIIVVALIVACLASLAVGTAAIPLHTVWDALTAYDPANPEHIAIVLKRLPRTIVGVAVGVALGLAGAVAQGVTRNPLADPGILGISQGAALAVVAGIVLFGLTQPSQYLWFAFAGACVAGVFVWAVASRGREGATPVKLALAGAAVAAAFSSLVAGLLIANRQALDTMRFWQVGSLAGRGFDVLLPALPALVVGTAAALMIGRMLNLFALGDDTASALGLRVGRSRLIAGAIVVVLAGAATAVAGPIAFLGLVVPHAVRVATGPDYRWILAYSAPAAAALLVAADVVARVVARPGEVQVGIVLAVLGAPVFIALVRRGRAVAL